MATTTCLFISILISQALSQTVDDVSTTDIFTVAPIVVDPTDYLNFHEGESESSNGSLFKDKMILWLLIAVILSIVIVIAIFTYKYMNSRQMTGYGVVSNTEDEEQLVIDEEAVI